MFQDIAPHRFNNAFFKDAISPEDVLLCYSGSHILLQPQAGGSFALPRACHVPQQNAMEAIYLFSVDDTRYFGFGSLTVWKKCRAWSGRAPRCCVRCRTRWSALPVWRGGICTAGSVPTGSVAIAAGPWN